MMLPIIKNNGMNKTKNTSKILLHTFDVFLKF